jgi:hypothetical protein
MFTFTQIDASDPTRQFRIALKIKENNYEGIPQPFFFLPSFSTLTLLFADCVLTSHRLSAHDPKHGATLDPAQPDK